jgi:predicted O-methyltransferase YrrM
MSEILHLLAQFKERIPGSAGFVDGLAETWTREAGALLAMDRHFLKHYPPGHFYSPLPSREEVARVADRAFRRDREAVPGIDLRERGQLRLYASLVPYHAELPFDPKGANGLRYHYYNGFFEHADAFWLYALMRKLKPKRIIEVGSGFSSCVMLDTNDLFLDGRTRLTFIEPYPERLLANIRPGDAGRTTIIRDVVQNVPLSLFEELEEGDFLFIDSSHVAKIGSDVLYLLHEVLPALKPGVLIHFHDIFYPFEYPRAWYEQGGKAWNEAYFLRAFLQYNAAFEIILFGNWLCTKHRDIVEKHTPVCLKNVGGSLWLRKGMP